MSATITIELCAEDRARLDHINVNLTELILRVMGSQKIDMGEVLRRAAPVMLLISFVTTLLLYNGSANTSLF